jgi:hypothetical protein
MGKMKAAAEAAEKSTNPREMIGSNNPPIDMPPIPEQVGARITAAYAELEEQTAKTLLSARDLPKEIADETDNEKITTTVVDMRKIAKNAEAYRVKEKDPYLTSERLIDNYFKGIIGRLDKAMEILTARAHAWNKKKEAQERIRLETEQREAARIAEAATEKLRQEQAAANEAVAAAARARKPENIEAHEQKAEQHAENVAELRVDTLMALDKLQEASLAASVKTADIVRTRFDTGAMSTMAQISDVRIVDATKLNKDLLWPFIKEDHLLIALKAWAKTKNHQTSMDGAIIQMVDDTRIIG